MSMKTNSLNLDPDFAHPKVKKVRPRQIDRAQKRKSNILFCDSLDSF